MNILPGDFTISPYRPGSYALPDRGSDRTYVERRKRCRAAQFLRAEDAGAFASRLKFETYAVHHGPNNEFYAEFKTEQGDPVKLNRGDYVKNGDDGGPPYIVRREDFDQLWELEPQTGPNLYG